MLKAAICVIKREKDQDNWNHTQHDALLQAQAPDWHAQLQHELQRLERKAPHVRSDIDEVIQLLCKSFFVLWTA